MTVTRQPRETAPADPLARLMRPDRILACLGMPRDGRVHELGAPLGHDMPAGPTDTFAGFRIAPYRTPTSLRDPTFDGHDFSMEVLSGSPHLGTHIDGLAHIQSQGRIFGGHAVADAYGDWGWHVNGIEGAPPIITRGILLDLPRDLGIGAALPDGFQIEPRHVQASLRARGVDVGDGDAVLVRTGKLAADYERDPAAYFGPQPGVGPDAAIWLHERGMAILGTDTSGTEALPFPDPTRTTHRVMIVERGVHLLEILDLEAVAAAGVVAFLFICLPLRIRGGTGSWVRPIAIT
jgi:kynurenine formamidase